MGIYDFDTVIAREGTNSVKFDAALRLKGRDDLLPLWVADMDFRLPKEILEALKARVKHGIFGYAEPGAGYFETLQRWFQKQYRYRFEKDWNTITPGVVFAIGCAIRACTEPGDAVLIQPPVYPPFAKTIRGNGRKIVNSQLLYENGAYRMDFDGFEHAVIAEKVKLFILCSPHNPVGRVWTEEELLHIAEICERHKVTVVADEIHCDFIYPGHRFTPWLTLPERYARQAIVCTSPSKTFNLAGLQIANILIPDETLRSRFRREVHACGYGPANAMGLAATEAAYRKGLPWLKELRAYLNGNLDFVRTFLAEKLPRIRLVEPEGTYLIWLDCTGLGLTREQLSSLMEDRAKLWLDHGDRFGAETALFERLNIAAPRAVLERAMRELEAAISGKI